MKGKKVVVCDYNSKYSFPPKGYGGIERWLWTVANQSFNLGMNVLLLGPQWRHELLPGANHDDRSILDVNPEEFLKTYGKMNYLVAGHEYWHKQELRYKFELIAEKSISFQHMPNPIYKEVAFDNARHFLFCYSEEMMTRFELQKPQKVLCVAEGDDELPNIGLQEQYLVWIGRLDKEKAPHYAIKVAQSLNLPIYLLGNSVKKNFCYDNYLKSLLNNDLVKRYTSEGCDEYEVTGKDKMDLIGRARVGIYTIDPDYIESGAGVFAEYLRSGVPVAALSWKGNDCSIEAVGDGVAGNVFIANKNMSELSVVNGLVNAVKICLSMNRNEVLDYGREKYDPAVLVNKMYALVK